MPSYISFRSALSKYGIISEVPYVLEMAAIKSTRRRVIGGVEVLYRKMKKQFFFGYALKNGVFIAEPEKAFLDILYMKVTGKDKGFDPAKADLSRLDRKKLMKYAKAFPDRVKSEIRKYLKDAPE